MLRLKFLAFAGLLLATTFSFGQNNYGKVWVNGGGISYSTSFESNGIISNNLFDTTNGSLIPFIGGHSNICDANGNLILVSDGYNIYDYKGVLMDGGYKLVPDAIYNDQYGSSSGSQSSLFLPLEDNKYLFITPTASDYVLDNYWYVVADSQDAYFDDVLYNIIDMNSNGGVGRVVKRMQPLLEHAKLSKSQMMACRHGDGKSWWLFKQARDTNMIYSFLLNQDTVLGPFIQGFAEPHFGFYDQGGQSVFSLDGTKYATTCRGAGKIFVADFDRCSGLLANPKTYVVPVKNYFPTGDTVTKDPFTEGLAFSPNGRFIYVDGYANIQQLDLDEPDSALAWYHVANMDTDYVNFAQYSSLYLALDNKLYIGNWNAWGSQMSAINNPDGKGADCNFCPRCLRFPQILDWNGEPFIGNVSSPPTMANYKLGVDSNCIPTTVASTQNNQSPFSIFPNPTTGNITARYSLKLQDNGVVQIMDMQGRVIREERLNTGGNAKEFNINGQASGIYFYRLMVNGAQQASGKITLIN